MTAYRAELLDAAGNVMATTDTRAWNSAIRASESLARAHARAKGVVFDGRPADVEHADGGRHDKSVCGYDCVEREYRRGWTSDPDGLGIFRSITTVVRVVA